MAPSVADLSATDLALYAADKPILVGRNWLRSAGSFRGWDANGVSAFTDIAASGFDSKFGGDDYDHVLTKPNAAATAQYYVFDYGSEAMEFDCWALLNHNLGTIGGVTVELQVADDNAFSVNLFTIATITPGSSNKRLVSLVLDDSGSTARRWTNYRYFRVKFSKGSAITPQFGEMILGRRRQLKHKPNTPWDPNNLASRIGRFESASGIITDYVFHKGRRKIAADLSPHESAYINDLVTFYETDIDFGTLPFLWIDDPTTSPSDANWMKLVDPELTGPVLDVSERSFAIRAMEHGPNFLKLGV